jgi:phosphatidylserine/phosphatidylglycerophosphate/cardiolipin synthase-like enzyme
MYRLYSPYDDIQGALLAEVKQAKERILMLIYSFHLPPLTDILIEKHKAGLLIQCGFDLSQSRGKEERQEVQRLIAAGLDIVIGTSPVHNQIMHEKAIALDNSVLISGSYNFSLSAEQQVNHCDFMYSPEMVERFAEEFAKIRAVMKGEANRWQ